MRLWPAVIVASLALPGIHPARAAEPPAAPPALADDQDKDKDKKKEPLHVQEEIQVTGRSSDVVGIADSATEG